MIISPGFLPQSLCAGDKKEIAPIITAKIVRILRVTASFCY